MGIPLINYKNLIFNIFYFFIFSLLILSYPIIKHTTPSTTQNKKNSSPPHNLKFLNVY